MTTFSPLDLLTISSDEQEVLRCLNRQPKQTISEIARSAGLSQSAAADSLEQLLEEGRIVEQLYDQRRVFSARFGRSARTQVRNMPQSLLAVFDEAPELFLEDVPLTQPLTGAERKELLQLSREQKLLADEVVAWQGKVMNFVGVVKNGLLRRTNLQGAAQSNQTLGFVRRCDWLGLVELLSGSTSSDTLIAAADTELLIWRQKDFMRFLEKTPTLGVNIGKLLGQELIEQRLRTRHGHSRLWVVDGFQRKDGATTLANQLATLAATESAKAGSTKVIVWNATDKQSDMLAYFNIDASKLRQTPRGQELLLELAEGPDLLLQMEDEEFPPQVQLEILLNKLRRQYDYIIADTGAELDTELMLRLRGQADVMITITSDSDSSHKVLERWQDIRKFSAANQQRFLVLNKAEPDGINRPDFHMVLPLDPGLSQSDHNGRIYFEANDKTPLNDALSELYRRLSLTHSIGIFIPSTLDVNVDVDNTHQVQSALAFLGNIFGGATSSNAEGVWQSNEGGLVTEQVTIVRTFVSQNALNNHLDEVLDFAKIIKEQMGQEAVALDVDNQLILV